MQFYTQLQNLKPAGQKSVTVQMSRMISFHTFPKQSKCLSPHLFFLFFYFFFLSPVMRIFIILSPTLQKSISHCRYSSWVFLFLLREEHIIFIYTKRWAYHLYLHQEMSLPSSDEQKILLELQAQRRETSTLVMGNIAKYHPEVEQLSYGAYIKILQISSIFWVTKFI